MDGVDGVWMTDPRVALEFQEIVLSAREDSLRSTSTGTTIQLQAFRRGRPRYALDSVILLSHLS